MTKLSLPSGEWLIVKVQMDAHDFNIDEHLYYKARFLGKLLSGMKKLPPGSWQLYGADPLRLTEKECKKIVMDDYGVYPDYKHEGMIYQTATESFAPLLTANGHKVGEAVILKNKI